MSECVYIKIGSKNPVLIILNIFRYFAANHSCCKPPKGAISLHPQFDRAAFAHPKTKYSPHCCHWTRSGNAAVQLNVRIYIWIF